MKDIINSVLYRHSSNQSNLASEKCRDTIASEIEAVLESKGSYTEYSDYELEKREAKKHWVCSICGKNTYDVDWDYIGSDTNHLGCELDADMKNPQDPRDWMPPYSSQDQEMKNKDDDADYYTGPDGHYEKYGDIVHKLPDE